MRDKKVQEVKDKGREFKGVPAPLLPGFVDGDTHTPEKASRAYSAPELFSAVCYATKGSLVSATSWQAILCVPIVSSAR